MMIAFLIAAGMNLFSYWNADKMVLRMHRAQQVDEGNAPEYYGIVRDLAQRAGLPMPKVYIVDSPHPNAFATGRNPDNAAVAATTGLLDILSRDERDHRSAIAAERVAKAHEQGGHRRQQHQRLETIHLASSPPTSEMWVQPRLDSIGKPP